jgi:hypothetical protein
MANTKTGRPLGPPTKKNEKAIALILEAAATGVPLRFCAAAGGITVECLRQWRDKDPAFDARIEEARWQSVRKRWLEIQKIGQGTKNNAPAWQAIAWSLERSFPSEFAKPEAQLAVAFNQQTVNNTLVISAETAERLEQRSRKINSEIDELLKARQAKFESRFPADAPPERSAQARVIEAEVVASELVTLPPENQRTSTWWRSLSRGSSERAITPEAALFVIETVATQVFGLVRAAKMEIEFDSGEPRLRDVYSAIEQLCGPLGWETLVSLGESS